MKIVIDGKEFTGFIHKNGLSEQQVKQYGHPDIKTLSGKTFVDLRGIKRQVVLTCNPLDTQRKRELQQACAPAYVQFTYNANPDKEADTTFKAIPTISAARSDILVSGVRYWSGIQVTMKEQ